jgi:hypothetical protein
VTKKKQTVVGSAVLAKMNVKIIAPSGRTLMVTPAEVTTLEGLGWRAVIKEEK